MWRIFDYAPFISVGVCFLFVVFASFKACQHDPSRTLDRPGVLYCFEDGALTSERAFQRIQPVNINIVTRALSGGGEPGLYFEFTDGSTHLLTHSNGATETSPCDTTLLRRGNDCRIVWADGTSPQCTEVRLP